MKCLVKVKAQIFKCTGLMPSDLGDPYIHSATALCDYNYSTRGTWKTTEDLDFPCSLVN